MNKNIVVAVLIGILFGALGTTAALHATEKQSDMNHAMEGMTAALVGKTGDEFDKAFLTEMIVHHEGAVEMAQMALHSSSRAEIQALAEAVVEAQTREIEDMRVWQMLWFGEHHN